MSGNTGAAVDPLEAAAKAQLPPSFYFGQVAVDAFYCVLQKGSGKVVFDPAVHSESQKRVSLKVTITSLPDLMGNVRTFARDLIAESIEWVNIVNPSVAALGLTPKTLNEKYVKLTIVPAGRSYDQKDKDTGVTTKREATTFKFLELFPNADACQAAADALYGGAAASASSEAAPESYEPATMAPPAAAAGNDPAKATAAMFLAPLWAASKKNVNAFADLIAQNPLVSAHFTINSPEVLALVSAG